MLFVVAIRWQSLSSMTVVNTALNDITSIAAVEGVFDTALPEKPRLDAKILHRTDTRHVNKCYNSKRTLVISTKSAKMAVASWMLRNRSRSTRFGSKLNIGFVLCSLNSMYFVFKKKMNQMIM